MEPEAEGGCHRVAHTLLYTTHSPICAKDAPFASDNAQVQEIGQCLRIDLIEGYFLFVHLRKLYRRGRGSIVAA